MGNEHHENAEVSLFRKVSKGSSVWDLLKYPFQSEGHVSSNE